LQQIADFRQLNFPFSKGGLMLPKGPKGSWLPTLKFIRSPRKMLEQWRSQFGDPFYLLALNGPIVLTGREDLIREIFGTDPDKFDQFAVQTIVPLLGSGSIFALTGAAHRRERKLLMPMFHGDRMRSYGADMCELAFTKAEDKLTAGRFEALPMMTDISFRVIVKNIIGGTDPQEVERLVAASQSVIKAINPLLLFTKRSHFSFFGLTPWDRFIQAKEKLFNLVDQIIDSHLSRDEKHDDILSLLCQATYEDGQAMSREHIRDELLTFSFAGHETTALTLTWAMYHLHRHPPVLRKLQEELDSMQGDPSEFAAAPYLKACIQETLRIHPIVTEVVRKLREPMELGEFTIPAGFTVSPVAVLAHYNPDVFPQPDEFRPERFIDKSYSPFCYMPFGGGHRRCIGAAFASYELAMVLGTLIKHFSFELIESQEVVPVRRNVTMAPSSKVPLKIVRRN
jgi:cytochrome P450 family 110